MALIDLCRQRGEIVFLQETHFRADAAPSLTSRYYPQSYFSNYVTSKTRGVAILVARHVPFVCTHQRTDPQGRYLFIKGLIGSRKITLANIYLPNTGQCGALRSTLSKLSSFQEGLLVCGGDFNVPLDTNPESVKPTPTPEPSLRRRFMQLLHQHQLIDGWRVLNPSVKDFTFYSHAAKTYSRLDTFMMSHHHLHALRSASIAPITWSDHAPVLCAIEVLTTPPPQCTWRLNESLLRDVVIRQDIKDNVEHYFAENSTSDVSLPMIWEAHKCVIRGKLIQIGAQRKKTHRESVTTLLARIHDLETEHKTSRSISVFKELTIHRAKLNTILSDQAFKSLRHTKQLFYTQGNRCGKLLARALKRKQQTTFIPKVQSDTGTDLHLNTDITEAFHKYFSTLYQLRDTPPDKDAIQAYLKDSL
uniref:exodeoxyribonuclease III n=1 Tax=Leptobrachium leishanense TaxID=445787 RepID=A0A8C5QN92_9ANUR